MQDDLSRLTGSQAVAYGGDSGYRYVDLVDVSRSYFADRLSAFAVILPPDNGHHTGYNAVFGTTNRPTHSSVRRQPRRHLRISTRSRRLVFNRPT